MIRRHVTALRVAALVLDLAVATLLFLVVAALRFPTGAPAGGPLPEPAWPMGAALGWGAAWVAILWARGVYGVPIGWSWRRETAAVVVAGAIGALVVLSVLFVLRLVDMSRLFLVALVVAQVLLTLASRRLLHAGHVRMRRHGLSGRHLLVVGAGPTAAAFVSRVAARPSLGLVPIGRLDVPVAPSAGPAGTHAILRAIPVLGDLASLETVLHGRIVDEVAICLEPADQRWLGAIAARCREEGKACHVPVAGIPPSLDGGVLDQLDGLAVLSLLPRADHAAAYAVKRAVDVAGAIVLLLAAVPLLVVLGALIRVVDGGPVLFHQRRIGRHGRPFRMLKLRTMSLDAEERLADLAPRNEVQGSAFKLSRDPRLTRTGAFLRRTSLDELPQLWNVVRGEMSLVGPRPPLPEEVEAYEGWHRRRLSVTPGMTGLWQVEGRHHPHFDHWVRLDLAYIDRWSLRLDLVILLRTIPAVLGRDGR